MDTPKENNSKIKDVFSSKYTKAILIVFEAASLLTIIVLICLVVKGDITLEKNDKIKYETTTFSNIKYKQPFITENAENNFVAEATDDEKISSGSQFSGSGNTVVTVNNSSTNSALADPSGWSKSKIISTAEAALNKTRAYAGNVTVNHTESFVADVTECTGGDIVKTVANLMIGWIVKPVDEVLSFSGGRALNSEGEALPLGLPIRNNFSLTQAGAASANITRSGNEYIIKIKLIEEKVGMYEVPKHNAASIGYLDVANFDLSLFTVDSADIVYKGSSIEVHINSEGYVTYAKYNIPLNVSGSAHRGSISGSAVFNGEQTEIWDFRW